MDIKNIIFILVVFLLMFILNFSITGNVTFCTSETECGSTGFCTDGVCKSGDGFKCEKDEDCLSGYTCVTEFVSETWSENVCRKDEILISDVSIVEPIEVVDVKDEVIVEESIEDEDLIINEEIEEEFQVEDSIEPIIEKSFEVEEKPLVKKEIGPVISLADEGLYFEILIKNEKVEIKNVISEVNVNSVKLNLFSDEELGSIEIGYFYRYGVKVPWVNINFN